MWQTIIVVVILVCAAIVSVLRIVASVRKPHGCPGCGNTQCHANNTRRCGNNNKP